MAKIGLYGVTFWKSSLASTDLRAEKPPSGPSRIMHGDYAPHNTIFAHDAAARLLAIVDWEQSTIGDPLMDLGLLVAGWSQAGEPDRFGSYCRPRDGLPTRRELIDRYEAQSGVSTAGIRYYEVLAVFKLACVLEGNYRLFVTGASDKPIHERMGALVEELVELATSIASGED